MPNPATPRTTVSLKYSILNGTRVKLMMRLRKMSVRALCRDAGVCFRALRIWMNGKPGRNSSFKRLAEALDMPFHEIINEHLCRCHLCLKTLGCGEVADFKYTINLSEAEVQRIADCGVVILNRGQVTKFIKNAIDQYVKKQAVI